MFECLQNVVEVIVQSRVPILGTPSIRPSGAVSSTPTTVRGRNRVRRSDSKGAEHTSIIYSSLPYFYFGHILAAVFLSFTQYSRSWFMDNSSPSREWGPWFHS